MSFSRVDYYNAVFVSVPAPTLSRLHVAARVTPGHPQATWPRMTPAQREYTCHQSQQRRPLTSDSQDIKQYLSQLSPRCHADSNLKFA